MKTNVLLRVNLGSQSLPVEHKTKLVNLNDLVKIGNTYRKQAGLPSMRVDKIMSRKGIVEYKDMLEEKVITQNGVSLITKTYRGNSKKSKQGTWVHLKLSIRIAIEMSPIFADEVIETFITGKLLEKRDIAGENYKSLTSAISKFNNTNYMLVAKALNYIVFGKHSNELRQTATSKQLMELNDLQAKLQFSVDMGYIKSFDQLINTMRLLYNQKNVKF